MALRGCVDTGIVPASDPLPICHSTAAAWHQFLIRPLTVGRMMPAAAHPLLAIPSRSQVELLAPLDQPNNVVII